MDLPHAPDLAAPSRPASTSAGPLDPELDRAVSALADRAPVFAHTPPAEKAALLRASIPRILALQAEMAVHAGGGPGSEPLGPLAGAAWITGPAAWLAGVRSFAEALEDIAAFGRPALPPAHLRARIDGRVVAQIVPRSFAERRLHGGAEAAALFAEGVEPEQVIAGQAAFYRQGDRTGGVAHVSGAGGPSSAAPLGALHALFVEGKVALVALDAAQAWLGPLVERGLAPLIEAGFLRVAQVDAEQRARVSARLGEPVPAGPEGGPVVVVPALYGLDELWFIARRLASEVAIGAAFGAAAPREIVLAGGWPQRKLFVSHLERALQALPPRARPLALVSDAQPGADLPAGVLGVLTAGWDDPVEMLAAAVDLCNARVRGAATAEIVVHEIQEEDPEVAAALGRAAARLRHRVVAVNQWPALLALRGDAPWGARVGAKMLAQVDKTILRGPLRTARRPAYFYDNTAAPLLGLRLASFEAAPSVRALLLGARV